jgi:hypothetical protein
VESLTGVRITDHMVVEMTGVIDVVDAVGGVRMCLPEPVVGRKVDLNLPAGEVRLDGYTAINFLRARQGQGMGLELGSDLKRIERQQAFFDAMLREVLSQNLITDSPRLYRVVREVLQSISTGPDLASPAALAGLAWSLRDIDPAQIVFTSVPVVEAPRNPDRVVWTSEADAIWARIKADQPPPGSPTPPPSAAPSAGGTAAPTADPSVAPSQAPSETAAPSGAAAGRPLRAPRPRRAPPRPRPRRRPARRCGRASALDRWDDDGDTRDERICDRAAVCARRRSVRPGSPANKHVSPCASPQRLVEYDGTSQHECWASIHLTTYAAAESAERLRPRRHRGGNRRSDPGLVHLTTTTTPSPSPHCAPLSPHHRRSRHYLLGLFRWFGVSIRC